MNLVVEIPQGSRIKIQGLEQGSTITYRVDRITDTPFPAAYGFIQGTTGPDGDPLDAFLITTRQLYTGDRFPLDRLTHLGSIQMTDDGESDPKELYFLGDDLVKDIKFVVQRICHILVHLKTYKLRGDCQGLVQGRILINGLHLCPVIAKAVQGTTIIPYLHP